MADSFRDRTRRLIRANWPDLADDELASVLFEQFGAVPEHVFEDVLFLALRRRQPPAIAWWREQIRSRGGGFSEIKITIVTYRCSDCGECVPLDQGFEHNRKHFSRPAPAPNRDVTEQRASKLPSNAD